MSLVGWLIGVACLVAASPLLALAVAAFIRRGRQ